MHYSSRGKWGWPSYWFVIWGCPLKQAWLKLIDHLLLFKVTWVVLKLYIHDESKLTNDKLMVLNATFDNISVISWRSVLLVEKTFVLSQVTDTLYHIMLYNLPWYSSTCICRNSVIEIWCTTKSTCNRNNVSHYFNCFNNGAIVVVIAW
jgi:hypothetical protein